MNRISKSLLLFLAIVFTIAALGGLATGSSVSTWYLTLNKPPFNPPGWIFGPVWTVLYIMIGVSGWMVYKKTGWNSMPLNVYFVQLVLNGIWSPVFFGLRQPMWAFFIIALLWISIVLTLFQFKKVEVKAMVLLLPYFLWVSFASILNYEIWRLN